MRRQKFLLNQFGPELIHSFNGKLLPVTNNDKQEQASMSATISRQMLTPPAVAKLMGVGVSKILGWIYAGEIEAVNLAADTTKRPRWGVPLESIEQFKRKRAAVQPAPSRSSRRTKLLVGRKYF